MASFARGPAAAASVLLLLLASSPFGPTASATDAPELVGGGSFAHVTPLYSIEVRWPDHVTSLADGAEMFEATLQHAGREATFQQTLHVGDVFFRGLGLVKDRFVVLGSTSTTPEGHPRLRLEVSRSAGADVPELLGEVVLTFEPDAIRHEQEFHLPHVVFADSVFSTTVLEWGSTFAAHGSVHPNGTVVSDHGFSLDPYGEWKQGATYGVFQTGPDALVGHARLRQGEDVNYLGDGTFRVDPKRSSVNTVFTAFLDAPSVGLGRELRVTDAIVFGASTTAAYHARILEMARPKTTKLFDPADVDIPTPTGPIPHVVVAIPDSGINPYHEIYYRPNLTAHPCVYVEGFPCSIPALPLSVGMYSSYDEAFEADRALWDSLVTGQWYWIPRTVFIAVMCEGSSSLTTSPGQCIIDDTDMHGTGTTSSVLTENPNALLVFKEGNSATSVFESGLLPIDIVSYSWGSAVPLALPGLIHIPADYSPFFVAASGNEGAFPVVLDSDKASHAVINVGAADAATRTEPGYSGWKTADFVSEYCRPTAQTRSIHEYRESYCGTSFSAPTFAGALSKVILEVRRESGYTGGMRGQVVDPILGVTKADVREALNRTATYAPNARFPADSGGVPLVEAAPWYQWGWGYVDSTVIPATLRCLREEVCPPEKDIATRTYMEGLWAFRGAYGGWWIFDAYDCYVRGIAAACDRVPP